MAARERDAVVGVRPPRRDLPSRPVLGLDPQAAPRGGAAGAVPPAAPGHRDGAARGGGPRHRLHRRPRSTTWCWTALWRRSSPTSRSSARIPASCTTSRDVVAGAGVPRLGRAAGGVRGAPRGAVRGPAAPATPTCATALHAHVDGRSGAAGGQAGAGDVPADRGCAGRRSRSLSRDRACRQASRQPLSVVGVREGEPDRAVVPCSALGRPGGSNAVSSAVSSSSNVRLTGPGRNVLGRVVRRHAACGRVRRRPVQQRGVPSAGSRRPPRRRR